MSTSRTGRWAGGSSWLRHAGPADWSICQKVVIAPFVAISVLGCLIYLGWSTLDQQQRAFSTSYQHLAARKEIALRLPHVLARIQKELYKLTIWSQIGVRGEEMATTHAMIDAGLRQIDAAVADFDAHHLSEQLEASTTRYRRGVEQALLLIARRPMLGATATRGVENVYLEAAETADLLARSEEAAFHREVESMQRSFNDLAQESLLVALGAGALMIAAALRSARMIATPIRELAGVVNQLGDNNLDVAIPWTDRRDEIGLVARAMESFKASVVRNRELELEREQINLKLERKVADRTRELADQKERLALALNKERELNGLQRQFVSMVSHEFRTPLAVIDGNAQRLMRRHESVSADRLHDGLGKIRTSVIRLTDLMESVLGAARLEAGSIQFKPQPCNLIDMIGELCSNHQEVNGDRHISVDVQQLPRLFTADIKLLRQVVSNLVSNAIKYSAKGTSIWVQGRSLDDGGIVISVRDEGVGIPADEIGRLFDRFFRATTSTGTIGTGIGLHIVKTLSEMHGGSVSVASTEGVGTTFSVHLPRRDDPDIAAAGAA